MKHQKKTIRKKRTSHFLPSTIPQFVNFLRCSVSVPMKRCGSHTLGDCDTRLLQLEWILRSSGFQASTYFNTILIYHISYYIYIHVSYIIYYIDTMMITLAPTPTMFQDFEADDFLRLPPGSFLPFFWASESPKAVALRSKNFWWFVSMLQIWWSDVASVYLLFFFLQDCSILCPPPWSQHPWNSIYE